MGDRRSRKKSKALTGKKDEVKRGIRSKTGGRELAGETIIVFTAGLRGGAAHPNDGGGR